MRFHGRGEGQNGTEFEEKYKEMDKRWVIWPKCDSFTKFQLFYNLGGGQKNSEDPRNSRSCMEVVDRFGAQRLALPNPQRNINMPLTKIRICWNKVNNRFSMMNFVVMVD